MTEIIEITGGGKNNNNAKWSPVVGEETYSLIKFKGFTNNNGDITSIGEQIINETYRILEMCGNPENETNNDTGIVIGYVQSGKTLSFTALSAMARDNNYQMIIIIAGTSIPLSEQSYERMRKDLQIDTRFDRKWTILKNPNPRTNVDKDTIEMKLEQWKDNTYPDDECSTVLITVMKNSSHLRNLTNVLRDIDLTNVPTLIIDDESDQASLNTRARADAREGIDVNEGEASTIYRRINELRSVFPHHTFLQYTATPQANLFINIMDRLSPNFIKLLTPGNGYTGGKVFFIDNPFLIREIPFNEIPTNNNPIDTPPDTLLYALKIYYLGVSAGLIKKDQRNRSMMIHPSRLTNAQNVFYNWVRNISDSWHRLLSSSDDEEKQELIDEFKIAYEDLNQTVSDLPPFNDLLNRLVHAIRNTRIIEVNARAGRTPEIRWSDFYSHILVGGQAMARGFTVEGLTVTYMPRSLATGQVDTTLQRARFFGYKGSYLGYCRVWIDQQNIEAFRAIIEHEEDVRSRLDEYNRNNIHLNDWDREVVLAQMLRLTRPNVIYNDLDRDYFGSEWFYIKAPHDTEHLIQHNINIVNDFNKKYIEYFIPNEGHEKRTDLQKHLILEMSLNECLNDLLNKLKYTRESDSQTFSSLRGILNQHVEDNAEIKCKVILMSSKKENGKIKQEIRKRRLNRNDEIQQLFQGKQPTKSNNEYQIGEIYPGDREIKDPNKICVQIHRLHLRNGNEDIFDEDGNVLYTDVPTIAVWIPEEYGKDIIRQPDNHEFI